MSKNNEEEINESKLYFTGSVTNIDIKFVCQEDTLLSKDCEHTRVFVYKFEKLNFFDINSIKISTGYEWVKLEYNIGEISYSAPLFLSHYVPLIHEDTYTDIKAYTIHIKSIREGKNTFPIFNHIQY